MFSLFVCLFVCLFVWTFLRKADEHLYWDFNFISYSLVLTFDKSPGIFFLTLEFVSILDFFDSLNYWLESPFANKLFIISKGFKTCLILFGLCPKYWCLDPNSWLNGLSTKAMHCGFWENVKVTYPKDYKYCSSALEKDKSKMMNYDLKHW